MDSLNSAKCEFCKEDINFLGFRFQNGSRCPDPNRFSALLSLPLPTDARQLQRFIGMCTFFLISSLIRAYTDLITPLYAKLKSFSPWSDEKLFCFNQLKESIFSSLHVDYT